LEGDAPACPLYSPQTTRSLRSADPPTRALQVNFDKALKPSGLGKLLVDVGDLGLFFQPEVRVGEGLQFLNALALFFDPGEVLLVVPTGAVVVIS
jgi:hypothetical protein